MKAKKFQRGELIKFPDNNRLYYVVLEPCYENIYTVTLLSVDGKKHVDILPNTVKIQKHYKIKE